MPVYLDRFGKLYELRRGGSLLGRAPVCDIRLLDQSVSRRHLLLELDDDGVIHVEDLGSTNGTLVNGELLPPRRRCRLEIGDALRIGIGIFVLRGQGARVQAKRAWDQAKAPWRREATPIDEAAPGAAARRPVQTWLTCQECWSEIPDGHAACPLCGEIEPPPLCDEIEQPPHMEAALAAPPPPQQDDHGDRRVGPRVAVELPVIYTSDVQSFCGVARDLGPGGVFVASDRWDPEVTACRLMLLQQGLQIFSISGEVRHVASPDLGTARPPGLGIKFTSVPDEVMAWIHETVREHGDEWCDTSSS